MRTVGFFGTPEFAASVLKDLLSDSETKVLFCVTNPDKPFGRSAELLGSPVSTVATAAGIPVFKPAKVRGNAEFLSEIAAFAADYFIVAAYGKILPNEVLELPKKLCANVHGSVLPKYRGASPVQEAVKNGEVETGVSIMAMSEGMDEGDVLSVLPILIPPAATSSELFDEFSRVSGGFLLQTLARFEAGEVVPVPQRHDLATYCGKISKEDAAIDWNASAKTLYDRFRAFQPWPGFHTEFRGKRLSVVSADPYETPLSERSRAPGSVFELPDGTPAVVCGEGALILRSLKIE